ncbi:MAG: hypothetical protein AAF492_14055, partial [Verrucomicrobiota bacterium]
MLDPGLHQIARKQYRRILSRKIWNAKGTRHEPLADRRPRDYQKPGRWIYARSAVYVIGIIFLFGTVMGAFPWAYRWHEAFLKKTNHTGMDERGRKTLDRMKLLEKALIAYQETYGRIPTLSSKVLMPTLIGQDIKGSNPRKIAFFEYSPPRVDMDGRRWPGNVADDGRIYDYYSQPLRFKRVNWSSGPHIAIVSSGKRLRVREDNIIWGVPILPAPSG